MMALSFSKNISMAAILVLIGQTALAEMVIEIPVLFKISQKSQQLNDNFFRKNIFPEAEACLNESFSKAGSSIHIKFSILRVEVLSSVEEAGISENIDTEFHKIGDRPALKPQGNKASYVEAIVSDQVNTAHVPPVLTEALLSFYQSGAVEKQSELLASASDLCEQYYPECDLTAPDKIPHPKLKEIALNLMEIAKKYHLEQPEISNTMYLNAQFYLNIPTELSGVPSDLYPSRQFAHEMMHAWGGLSDRYYVDADPNNLMSGFACAFDDEQIRSIVNYRGINDR